MYLQTMLRDDYLTAMVIYFDVGFTKIHKPLWLSTGPRTSSLCPCLMSPCGLAEEELDLSRPCNETPPRLSAPMPVAEETKVVDLNTLAGHGGIGCL